MTQGRKLGIKQDDLPHPADFPINSTESRAAARAMLDSKPRNVNRVEIIHIGHNGEGLPAPEVVEWGDDLLEIVHLPGDAQ